MNASIQTKQEKQADKVTAIFLFIGLGLLISFFIFILPNVTRNEQVELYIRTSIKKEQQAEVNAYHLRVEKEIAEQYKKKISQ
ncbi:hypothetical protein FCL53_17065 [Elizabethkingia meningoseptica]|uniref:hypothetical protein n=1 Tax=Elizabethkingia meningoseptica TaxID=238 RepID=UPI0013652CE1|nr:hypothetical protein [Elizabethkingia meningoseptica]MVW93675.1 hypothetical protein [Elizabethkingia meningoseptica]